MHHAQIAILYKLRHSRSATFSELMRETELSSDVFKFHIHKLTKLGYLQKTAEGVYVLTLQGKEFANNLDQKKRSTQKQPKLSVLLVVPRKNDLGETEYLVQKRKRHPFYGFWGCISGPIQWGEDAEDTARREFSKQTGLSASFSVTSFYRKRDYNEGTGTILEDKLFIILEAHDVHGEFRPTFWAGGENTWMAQAELRQQAQYFASSDEAISMVDTGKIYESEQAQYQSSDY